ncbi:MAG: DUF4919 domain-containing protein [Bacteroidota bacterium]
MKKTILFLITMGSILLLKAQDYTKLQERANYFYENEEYGIAIRLYDSLLSKFPENTLYLTRVADSYKNTGNIKKAISFYREALATDNFASDAMFGLASIYDETGNMDSAIYFFRNYINLHPDSPTGYNRLAISYMNMQGFKDSAIRVSKKAIEVDPDNPRSYYVNAMAYLNSSLPVDAIISAQKGLEYDSTYALLYMPLGIGYLQRGDYEKAYDFLKKGKEKSNEKEVFVEYMSISRLYMNTDKKKIEPEENNRVYFSRIHSKDLEKLVKNVRDESSDYHYPDLLAKFNDHPLDFQLDEFFMLYLGFTTDKNYTPYFPENDVLDRLWESQKYQEYLNEARIYLLEHPVDYHIYHKMASVADYLGLEKLYYESLYRYQGFLRALMASGTGASVKEAMVICFPWHKNSIMSELGYSILDQTVIKVKNEVYERVTAADALGNKKDLYFNISIPYHELESVLDREKGNN